MSIFRKHQTDGSEVNTHLIIAPEEKEFLTNDPTITNSGKMNKNDSDYKYLYDIGDEKIFIELTSGKVLRLGKDSAIVS